MSSKRSCGHKGTNPEDFSQRDTNTEKTNFWYVLSKKVVRPTLKEPGINSFPSWDIQENLWIQEPVLN